MASALLHPGMGKLLEIVLAILLPPVAVLVKDGLGGSLLLNCLLCLLLWLPAQVHAVYVVAVE